MTASELLPVFARREDLLSELDSTAQPKGDLVRSLDVSRSTVDRTVRQLESQGLVERRDGGVRLTLTGQLLFDEYQAFSDRADDVLAARAALSALPPDATISPDVLVDADVTLADRTTPYRPAERQIELLEEASRIDLVATAIAPRFVDVYREHVIDGDTEMRTVVCPAVADEIVAQYPDTLSDLLATDRVSLRALDVTPPFSVSRFEYPDQTSVTVVIHSDDGPLAHVENDTEAAVSLVTEQFERYWGRAEQLQPSEQEL